MLVYMCPQCCKGLYMRAGSYWKAINCCCHKVGQQNGRGNPPTSWSLELEKELTSPRQVFGGRSLQSCAVHREVIGGALLLRLWEVFGGDLALCLACAYGKLAQSLCRNQGECDLTFLLVFQISLSPSFLTLAWRQQAFPVLYGCCCFVGSAA